MEDSIPPVAGVIYGLYCTCHPERGIRYVGRTIRPARKRLMQHAGEARRVGKYPVHRWMLKHGTENIAIEVLEESLTYEALAELEGKWIQWHSAGQEPLLNMVTVEAGELVHRHSPETRAKISAVHKGGKIPQSVLEQRKVWLAGEGNGMSKLTYDEVVEICELIWESIPLKDIASIYGVQPPQITRIAKGERWKSVPRPWGEEIPNLFIGRKFPTRRKVMPVA